MRIALISDIHGNLVALDATLREIATQRIDQIVCLGDIAYSGPQPHECVETIRALGCPTIMGNCDNLAIQLRREGRMPERLRGVNRRGAWVDEIDAWSALALTDDDAAYLAALPMTASIELGPGATLLCVHGSPLSFNYRLLPDTPVEQMEALISPVDALAMASGHTHVPMLRRLGALTIVNPGSVGLPLANDASGARYNPATYAEYGILGWEADRASDALTWEPRRITLDADAVFAAARASGMPHADRWRGDWSQP